MSTTQSRRLGALLFGLSGALLALVQVLVTLPRSSWGHLDLYILLPMALYAAMAAAFGYFTGGAAAEGRGGRVLGLTLLVPVTAALPFAAFITLPEATSYSPSPPDLVGLFGDAFFYALRYSLLAWVVTGVPATGWLYTRANPGSPDAEPPHGEGMPG